MVQFTVVIRSIISDEQLEKMLDISDWPNSTRRLNYKLVSIILNLIKKNCKKSHLVPNVLTTCWPNSTRRLNYKLVSIILNVIKKMCKKSHLVADFLTICWPT